MGGMRVGWMRTRGQDGMGEDGRVMAGWVG